MKLSIEVTSDFLCPWCRIAEARLEGVLKTLPAEIEVDMKWLPFELNPNMPVEGMDRVAYRSAKFGSWEYSRTLDAHTVEAGAGDGVVFNYEAMERVPNTLAAHRLVWFAPEGSIRNSLIERLFRAYFQEGKDIGDLSVLAEVAHEAGLVRSHVEAFLKSKAGEAEVIQLEDRARQSRINSVPAFNIAGTRLSGAVESEVLYMHIMDAVKHQQILGDEK